MKKVFVLISLLVLTTAGNAQISIRPQIGYNSSNLTKEFNNVTFGNDDGFQFGVFSARDFVGIYQQRAA